MLLMQIAILSFFHYFSYMFKKRDSVFEVEEGKFLSPKFDSQGLIPVITTDVKTGEVLMHGFMNSEALKKMLEHLKIINEDLLSIFAKNNIKPIECLNKKLDPNLHQAMMEIEDNQKDPGTIIQEIQKGFTIKDRLLRPSLVGVSKKNENNDQKTAENKENLKDK